MSEKFTQPAKIVYQEQLARGIFDLRIRAGNIAGEAHPGQFLSLYCDDASRLLPRPVSICGIDKNNGIIRMVYRIAGEGTREFSLKKPGESIRVTGPLGNGFPLGDKSAFIIGGGIGIPPLLELARQLDCEKKIILGYQDSDMFLKDEFEKYGDLYISTEDGSYASKGNVLDAIRGNSLSADIIYACGPLPMLRAIKAYAAENNIECFVSLEERMACGIGACLACVCKTKNIDSHSHVNNARICAEGPVFDARSVEF